MLHSGTRRTHQNMMQNPSLGIVESLTQSTQVNFSFQWNDDFQCHKYLTNLFLILFKNGQSKCLLKIFGILLFEPTTLHEPGDTLQETKSIPEGV